VLLKKSELIVDSLTGISSFQRNEGGAKHEVRLNSPQAAKV